MPTACAPCGLNSRARLNGSSLRLELEHDLAVLDRLAALGDEVADGATSWCPDVVPDPEHLDLSERVALLDRQARPQAVGVDEEADRGRGNPD
jgi:hypothetical protein